MWSSRFFPDRMFAPRYWPGAGGVAIVASPFCFHEGVSYSPGGAEGANYSAGGADGDDYSPGGTEGLGDCE